MIEVKELMIGDWYILSTGNVSINRQVDSYFYQETITHSWMRPIELTPEILAKNGWQKSEDIYGRECYCFTNPDAHYDDGAYYFDSGFFVFKSWGVDLAKQITEVHELQRALRCCELWELADNFKV